MPMITLPDFKFPNLTSDNAMREVVYLARQERIIHPFGSTDNAGRWYPDIKAEGGTPNVRGPSSPDYARKLKQGDKRCPKSNG